ncbi:hypothetical protein [Paraburkholderia denitrificans]|uniref:hypothetical protein n=1 Tax=Paraburkholderia denitrificans TaxID=694025 RepID=UPI00366BBF1D
MSRISARLIAPAALSVVSIAVHAGFDHVWAYDRSGVWNPNVQLAIEYSAVAVTAVGYVSTTINTPLFVQILPHGLTVGFSKRF